MSPPSLAPSACRGLMDNTGGVTHRADPHSRSSPVSLYCPWFSTFLSHVLQYNNWCCSQTPIPLDHSMAPPLHRTMLELPLYSSLGAESQRNHFTPLLPHFTFVKSRLQQNSINKTILAIWIKQVLKKFTFYHIWLLISYIFVFEFLATRPTKEKGLFKMFNFNFHLGLIFF